MKNFSGRFVSLYMFQLNDAESPTFFITLRFCLLVAFCTINPAEIFLLADQICKRDLQPKLQKLAN